MFEGATPERIAKAHKEFMAQYGPVQRKWERQRAEKIAARKLERSTAAARSSSSDEVAILKKAAAADRHARVVELCKRVAADPDATQAQRAEAAALLIKSAHLTGAGRRTF